MHSDTVPCLLELAEEFDLIGPERDDASDGSIGDTAHQSRSSNHNRDDVSGSSTPQTDSDGSPDIRAIDVDDSGPWLNGFTMQQGVDLIVGRCRSGAENRLVEIIYDKHAWYASGGWARVNYTGSNGHEQHAHFGAKADTGKLENDRRAWGLVEKWGDMALSSDDKAWIKSTVEAAVDRRVGDVVQRYDAAGQALEGTGNDKQGVDSALGYLARDLINLDNKVDAVAAAIEGSGSTSR